MIQIFPKLYIGNFDDAKPKQLFINEIDCVFNVSNDLDLVYPLNEVRFDLAYSKIGLIDGPGNKPGTLCAVGLHLYALTKSHHDYQILVCCHGGFSRSPAAIALYMAIFWGYELELSLMFLKKKDQRINVNPDLLREMEEIVPRLIGRRDFQHQ